MELEPLRLIYIMYRVTAAGSGRLGDPVPAAWTRYIGCIPISGPGSRDWKPGESGPGRK